MEPIRLKVGVAGLGIMGSAMAKNLARSGVETTVFNRTRESAEALQPFGINIAESPRALAEACDLIIVIVTNPEAVWALINGPQGILATNGSGKILVQSSTLNLATTSALADVAQAAGYKFLDAPVTGSKAQVEAGELIFEIGGDAETLEQARESLLFMGKEIVHAGAIGSGTALKLCMNLVVAQMTTGICEGTVLARALGLNPELLFDTLAKSPALNCRYFQMKRAPLLSHEYPAAFSLENMLKDLRFINGEALGQGLELPVSQAAQTLLERGENAKRQQEDLTVVAELI